MSLTERLLAAMNARDADAFAGLVAPDYRSEQPAHPSRIFRGRDQVRTNWVSVFAGVPDFSAALLTVAVAGDVEVGEWRWDGTHTDGQQFAMRGVTVFGVADGLIQWGRLYMEPLDRTDEGDITDMVQQTYRPPA
ncbi:MAG TPA: nuclear transport factor 2 family protein [Jatrophihabitantaceae bacterium]|nr:nuclear transport factor 2 family protein [Jatrophihabitantaceae bacterium]